MSLILFLPKIRPVFKTITGNRILLFLAVFVGVVTGVGGGVLRDLFAGNTPYIFVKHIYACASFIGAIIMAFIAPYNQDLAMMIGVLVIFVLRLLAAKYKWNLPKA